ncbi:MAG: Flp pilus assembly protein CpaB [Planctomycetota bacterium]|nr:MAG: Flp pilus assembly protein CpaB [Planctomycetota bacterium]
MRSKPLVLLTVALGCGMIAAVGVSKALMKGDSGTGSEAMVEILVATEDLSQADKISAEKVKLEKWPKRRVPEGAITKLEQVDGKFTRQMIFAGEPILEKKITDSRASFSVNVPPGYRIFDIEGEAGYIKPGDHVDIVGIFHPPGRDSVPETRTVMRNVKVHGINGNTSRDADDSETGNRNTRGTTFQLLVRENQLEALALAKGMGKLQLHLRPLDENDEEDADSGQEFLSWVQDQQKQDTEEKGAPILPGLFTQLAPRLNPSSKATPSAKKHRMVIVTPEGFTEYEWSDNDELPRPVSLVEDEELDTQDGGSDSNYENVSSGYGGYTPTYPNGADPSEMEEGGEGDEDESEESFE